jgi:hypothetical protein
VITTGKAAGFHFLRRGVERLAEFHDVQAALAEGRSNGRRGISLACRNLQLDVADYFLCHLHSPYGCNRMPACDTLPAVNYKKAHQKTY